MVFSYPITTDSAKVTVIGTIEGNSIILEHRGGESLGPKTIIPITIANDNWTLIVWKDLNDTNSNGLWDIGERLVQKFDYNKYNITNLEADVIAIDVEGNNIVLTGTLDIHPESDIGVKIDIDPVVDRMTVLRIKVTNYWGDLDALNIKIECKLPDGMVYLSHDPPQATYNTISGIWDIPNLKIGQSTTLNITIEVTYTQLALLLDGSYSITSTDWDIMLDGISKAIIDGYIPYNGQVELTIVQFGGWKNNRSWAQVELGGPIVIDSTNYMTISRNIQNIIQLGGGTAMSCAFRLAADVMSGDPNGHLLNTSFYGMASTHSDWSRQVVNLVTDGQPNIIYVHNERYAGWWPGNVSYQYDLGKANTEAALKYFKTLIPIVVADGDEIDAEAVGINTNISWLRDHVVQPQPGYDDWPPTSSGWVRCVHDYIEFAKTISKQFELIFNRTIVVEKITSIPQDPNAENNMASISILS